MSRRRWVHAALASALVPSVLVIGVASSSQAAPAGPSQYKAIGGVKQAGSLTMAKPTKYLAQTDPTLLNRTDSKNVSIVVKLDYASTVTYTGDVAGFAATSPEVTGRPLSGSAAEKNYQAHIVSIENSFVGALAKKVPAAKVGQKLRDVYGGMALTVPANKISTVLSIPGVIAVQNDAVNRPQTDASPAFIGATAVYPQLGGTANAGKGVIFGSLDTGIWPEHPAFADNGNLGAPPAKADGTARTCNFGDNPLTPANDPFTCNNKVIGGQAFLDTYLANNPPEVYTTARDSNGHGTHTSSTAAGDAIASAKVFDVERGPLNGLAPGAWVSVYKVCGLNGCYNSDSVAAVQAAVKDGVNVINFSIGGGATPYSDPVELAFLEAYKSGVFVSASAGNSGPGAGTAEHLSPWVTTVGASTQSRSFQSTLTVTAGDGASATFTGSSITHGVGPAPVVLASAAPYSDQFCSKAAPPGSFAGKIVVCVRGGTDAGGAAVGRVQKGFNVLKGGAVGMILYNPTLADTETDNHFLPAVHLADGTAFAAFAAAHPAGLSASFTDGVKVMGKGDVMASFSSRGPAGDFIKPDITAPGVQILAGNSPTPDEVASGPAGQYYQAIAGTSMSSPHIAGSALLEKALHPTWTPGQIKSALMTTATTSVVKDNEVTPADPFDMGSGRVQVNLAANPGLTFDETGANMAALQAAGGNHAVDINVPSIDAKVMPGRLTVTRTAKNVTGQAQTYRVKTTAPANSTITVSPSTFTVPAGGSIALKITIASSAPTAQYFGQVQLIPNRSSLPTLHLPVAFVTQQGVVTLSQDCTPLEINLLGTTTCTVKAQNTSFTDTTADLTTTTSINLPVVGASGAKIDNLFTVKKKGVTLSGAVPSNPSLSIPGGSNYTSLSQFPDTLTVPVGDEQFLFFNVPDYVYNGTTYSQVSIDSNGYVVPGVASNEDNNCCALTGIPSTARPNNVLAPFWTDLTGENAPGVLINVLATADGTQAWTVIEWRVKSFGTGALETFQLWLGANGTQDVRFEYPGPLPSAAQPFQVGAENINGTAGDELTPGTLPSSQILVTSSDPVAGQTVTYTTTVLGILPGTGKVTTTSNTPAVEGTTVVSNSVKVNARFTNPRNLN